MESFSDKLRSLGFKTAASLSPVPIQSKKSLEEEIGGRVIRNSLGEFVLREQVYPVGYHHGVVQFSGHADTEQLQKLTKFDRNSISLKELVFLDTETSGLSGGTGTFAFLVGIGRFEDSCFRLQQLIIRDPLEEAAMLLHLTNEIKDSEIFVTYNGKSFDLPILLNRYRLNRLPSSIQGNDHLDLLHLARKIWKNQLPSCGLKDLERDVLGFTRTDEDVPGWMIPEIYFDFLRTNDPRRLSNVIYHNAIDIISLAALFLHSSHLVEENKDLPGISPGDLVALGKAFADVGNITEAINIYTKFIDLYNNHDFIGNVFQSLAKLHKQNGDIQLSLPYWSKAASLGKLDSCIELAMYFEHRQKDYSQALYWANYALTKLKENEVPDGESIRHRIRRIKRKAGENV